MQEMLEINFFLGGGEEERGLISRVGERYCGIDRDLKEAPIWSKA